MIKYFVYIFLILLTGVGIYYLSNSKKNTNGSAMEGHSMDAMSKKPIAQSHRSYQMEITEKPSGFDPSQPAIFKFKIKNDKGEVLKDYSVVHTKIMHFIVVRKDLQYFQHLHPEFDKENGEYSLAITFPTDGSYRLFPDFTPGKSADNPQQLSVTLNTDINVGDLKSYKPQDVTMDTKTVKQEGEYEITYALPKPIKANNPIEFKLNVTKNGSSVTDLEEYLGAEAHGILLKKDTLDFAHLHATTPGKSHQMGGEAMKMDGPISRGPEIKFDYTIPESGVYKLFTQFQHEGKIITTDYSIEVK